MVRILLSVISGCLAFLLAGAGILFLGWLLWWLWSRQRQEDQAAPAEIELETPAAERGVAVRVDTQEAPAPAAPIAEPEAPVATLSLAPEAEWVPEPEPQAADAPDAARAAVLDLEDLGGDDDLLVIEGIGPRCDSVLRAAGIRTFRQLADAEVRRLEEILRAADPRLLHLCKPDTWPEQAALAAAGDWEAFQALTNVLKGGRRV